MCVGVGVRERKKFAFMNHSVEGWMESGQEDQNKYAAKLV